MNTGIHYSRMLLCMALCIGALGLTSCTTPDMVTGRNVYNIYSIQEDVELGQTAMAENIKQFRKNNVPINADPVRLAQINNIMHRITAVSDMPALPYEVTLIHTNIVNAFAMPGGQMVVFDGLYDPEKGLVRDEDELAAVIAHEIAHVNCRHSTEQLSKIMTATLAMEATAALLESNDEDDWAMAVRALFAVGAGLWVPVHSRRDEYEADRVGLFYMARAGFDPRAAPRIWKRVAEKEGGNIGFLSIFATHPANEARYKELNRLLPYALNEYAASTGHYPPGYVPSLGDIPQDYNFDWRTYQPP